MGITYEWDREVDAGFYNGMNTGWNPINPRIIKEREFIRIEKHRRELQNKTHVYTEAKKSHNEDVVKRTKGEIEQELQALENALYYYRIAERNALRVKNKQVLKSVVIIDILEGLLRFYEETSETVVELQGEICSKTGVKFKNDPKELTELSVKRDIVKSVFEILCTGIEAGLPLSREMFKSIVKDLEKLLDLLENNDGNKAGKLDVEKYYIEKCGKRIGMIICQNCKRPMLADIPYCFNCFDGRYS